MLLCHITRGLFLPCVSYNKYCDNKIRPFWLMQLIQKASTSQYLSLSFIVWLRSTWIRLIVASKWKCDKLGVNVAFPFSFHRREYYSFPQISLAIWAWQILLLSFGIKSKSDTCKAPAHPMCFVTVLQPKANSYVLPRLAKATRLDATLMEGGRRVP